MFNSVLCQRLSKIFLLQNRTGQVDKEYCTEVTDLERHDCNSGQDKDEISGQKRDKEWTEQIQQD